MRWHLPSAVSGAGETVAALAAHIAEADMAFAASAGSASSIVAPSRSSHARCGPRVRQENALRQAEREVGAHLVDALQRRRARLRYLSAVAHRGDVAEAEPGIIVARPDDAVEVDFAKRSLARLSATGRRPRRRAARRLRDRSHSLSSAAPDPRAAGAEVLQPAGRDQRLDPCRRRRSAATVSVVRFAHRCECRRCARSRSARRRKCRCSGRSRSPLARASAAPPGRSGGAGPSRPRAASVSSAT